MKKFLLSVFILICVSQAVLAEAVMRDYKSVQIAKGSFLKAISQRVISSAIVKVGDVEYFINPEDVFVGETNLIPKNSVYLGLVESVMSPVEGVNGSMKIRIYKVITPDNREFMLDAYVFWKGSTTIGGDLTPPKYYTKMPHYPGTWKRGVLQYVPTTIRYPGQPVAINAGDEVTFVINSDLGLY
jgi:hypothetical protein